MLQKFKELGRTVISSHLRMAAVWRCCEFQGFVLHLLSTVFKMAAASFGPAEAYYK